MNTHVLRDLKGKTHSVSRSSSRPGAFAENKKGVGPMRLWLPGQFNPKSVRLLRSAMEA